MTTVSEPRILVGVVGPCAAGKTTLISSLSLHGYRTRHIAQEHSYVPDMWQRLTKPDVLVFLDVSYPITLIRRKLNWDQTDLDEQLYRLRHARQHADLVIQTDHLSPEQVLNQVLAFLQHVSPAG